MVVMDHFTREIIGMAVVKGSPSGADVCRMFANICNGSGRSPRHLSSDHDPLFKFHCWQANLNIFDINEIKTVPETPWSHPFIERVFGTIRREYLDQTLFWNERDLNFKLGQFMTYYNDARVHSSILGKTPRGLSITSVVKVLSAKSIFRITAGKLIATADFRFQLRPEQEFEGPQAGQAHTPSTSLGCQGKSLNRNDDRSDQLSVEIVNLQFNAK